MVREPSAIPQTLYKVSKTLKERGKHGIHWVEGPENQSEPGDGVEKGRGLVVLGHCHCATVHCKLVDDHEVGNTSHGIVSPFRSTFLCESSEESSDDHDEIGNDGDEDVGTAQSTKERQIEEQKRGGDHPVSIASPVYLAVDVLGSVGNVLVRFLDDNVVVANAAFGRHGKVRNGSERGDEGGQDVEQAFLLPQISHRCCSQVEGS